MSLFSLFFDKMLLMETNFPNALTLIIFDWYKLLSFAESKMFVKKKGTYFLNCSHYVNNIFLRCPNYQTDEHLHCGRCGMLLRNNTKLKQSLVPKPALCSNKSVVAVYPSKKSCSHLAEDHVFYKKAQ